MNDSKMQEPIGGPSWPEERARYGEYEPGATAAKTYPDARALTLDAVRLIAEARREMAKEIAEALEAKASDTSYGEPEAVTEHLLAAAGIARKLGGVDLS